MASVQQQPRVVYVVQDGNAGQVQLPPAIIAGHINAGYQDIAKKTFIAQIILSCLVFWLCGFLFGLIAFILASKYYQLMFFSLW